ncbi:MAG TPA: hypothetical protein PLF40_26875, partial [Kofleriaceae bacterium]|nr:hypothetical protein [Kofleriaceae bacterium]
FVREVNDLNTYRIPVKQLEREFHESFISAYGNNHLSMVYARLIQKMYLIRLHNLDAVGPIHTITSMREHKGWLYLGGLSSNRIGRYRLPAGAGRPDFIHCAHRWGAGFSRGAAANPVA